jgi:type III secretory pathway component EscS
MLYNLENKINMNYFKDDETAWFVAVNIRWKIIMASVLGTMIAIFVPILTIRDEVFTLTYQGAKSLK